MGNGTIKRTECQAQISGDPRSCQGCEINSEAGRARNQVIQWHIAGGCLRIGVDAAKYPAAISARSCRTPWERQKSYVTLEEISGGAAAAKRANRMGGRRTKKRGSTAARRPPGKPGGRQPTTPYGSPGPRGRTTDNRAEGRTRGRARAKGPKPRGMGRPRNDHRAEARTTRSGPRERPAQGGRPWRPPQWRKRTGAPSGATGQGAVQ
jgi:hypothetical protein